jgi:photosystem II stability/assembly factor-like uncharacterized protein
MPKVGRAALISALVALPALATAAALRDNLFSVAMPEANVALAVGNFGSIYLTRDGGQTWQPRSSDTKEPLFSVAFADPRTGWIVGKSGVILRTTDGGETWTPQKNPLSPAKHFFKIDAIDARTAWAVGDWGAVVQTTDGGATWVDRSLGALPVERVESPDRMMQTITDDVILYDVEFLDAQQGFIAGEFGTLLATADGGAHWRQIAVPTEKTLFGLHFEDPQRGWVVGIDGIILRTEDGGQTWTTQNGLTATAAIEDVSFVEAMANPGLYAIDVRGDRGVVVGDSGAFFLSADGGRTWQRRALPEQYRLTWVRDANLDASGRAFLVGAAGFTASVQGDTVSLPLPSQADRTESE